MLGMGPVVSGAEEKTYRCPSESANSGVAVRCDNVVISKDHVFVARQHLQCTAME